MTLTPVTLTTLENLVTRSSVEVVVLWVGLKNKLCGKFIFLECSSTLFRQSASDAIWTTSEPILDQIL